MRIVTRAEWGARPPKTTPVHIPTPTPELWLHHAAGANLPGDDALSPADLVRIRSIQNFHMDVRGWSDIAYSFLMDPDGYVFEGRGPGIRGAHTAGHNSISHALCVMGNYETQPVDSDLVPKLVEFAAYGYDQGWWPEQFTGGHRDASGASTSCPGENLYVLIPTINEELDMPSAEEIASAVWNTKIKRAGNLVSAIQELADCKTLLLLQGQDANSLTDAELADAVDDLIAALPQATLDLLKEKL